MTFPPRPSSPLIILEPLIYLRAIAPDSDDWAYRRVLGYAWWWAAGEDDPPPTPPDPPPGEEDKRRPPPTPPPTPAFPLGDLLAALANWDTVEPGAWTVVQSALSAWLTTGPSSTT